MKVLSIIKKHFSLTVIIVAALLLELTTGVMYYSAQSMIQRNVERLVQSEMNAIYLCILNKLAKVEVTVDNMAWVVTDDLVEPDSLLMATRQLVEHNPDFLGSGVCLVPNYFSQKGRWYEPYSVRRADGTIESMQLGSASHDYTRLELYTQPIAKGSGHWSEPYLDRDGAKAMVTTYSVPVRDGAGKMAGILGVDFSLGWLDDVLSEEKAYQSTQRFVVTGNYHLLSGEDSPMYQLALEQLKADDDKNGYVVIDDEQGHKKHVYFTPVGGLTDWMLISVIDDSDVFRKLRTIRISLLLPLMIGLFFAGFIVYRSSRNLERLRKVNAEKDRIGGELLVASKIQQNMLPQEEVRDERIEVRGSLVPAREVGGDLYDYFIRDEKLFFCIGDVSGKGVASAMMMAVVQTKFRDFSAHENNPARIMQNINEGCCQNNKTNMFVTLFIGVLDLPTGRLRYCDAGHDAPMIIKAPLAPEGTTIASLPVIPHLPVGVFDDVSYESQEYDLLSNGSIELPTGAVGGASIFLYTDGLTEAMNSEHQQFGLERVKAVLAGSTQSPSLLISQTTEAVHGFVKEAEQSDDLTMLAIRYTTRQFETTLSETLIIRNDLKDVPKFSAFMKSVTEKLNMEQSLARQLRLAVEEAVVNVIDYAYPAGQEGEIEVRMMSDGMNLKTVIIDSGVAFDPTTIEKADTSLSAEDRQIGGLGILLVRELMDSVNFERTNKQNILTLTKKLNNSKTHPL